MNQSFKIKNEFQDFLKTSPDGSHQKPKPETTERILTQVRSDLNPNAFLVFSKLLMIHVFTAIVTLSICPQFGFRILGEGIGLMKIFMTFGHYGCLIACGAFFTSMSLLIASIALRGEELRKIRKNRLLELGALALLSLGFFIMIDAELIFSFAIVWFMGALLGSLATLELAWTIRYGVRS